MFKFVSERHRPKGAERKFTGVEAKRVWDSLIYLKIKCPEIDLKNSLKELEKWMPAPK
jgi:hypothetical protein